MRPARTIALAVSIALVVPPVVAAFPAPAYAQKAPSIRDQLPTAARADWDEGNTWAGKREPDWAEARNSFQRAYDLSKNPRVLYNVAICEKELHHYAVAIDTLKRELAEGKGKLSAAETTEVNQFIEDLSSLVGQLTIDVSERDADVYIDGERIDPAKLPGPIAVGRGPHKLRAAKGGFSDAEETTVVVPKSSTTAKLVLRPFIRTSLVTVTVEGATNATVKIDGQLRGPAPYKGQVNVQAQPHEFSAEAPGYVTATQALVVEDGKPLNVLFRLAMDQEKGKLVVVSNTEGAAIEIDGKVVGASRWEGPIEARTHQVTVKKTGYYPWTYEVTVPRGGERNVTATLNEDRNSSFVPWLVGTIVVGAAIIVGVVLLATPPDQKPARGTLTPYTLPTQSYSGFRF